MYFTILRQSALLQTQYSYQLQEITVVDEPERYSVRVEKAYICS